MANEAFEETKADMTSTITKGQAAHAATVGIQEAYSHGGVGCPCGCGLWGRCGTYLIGKVIDRIRRLKISG